MNARTAWEERSVVKDAGSIMDLAEDIKGLADKITANPRPSLREAFSDIFCAPVPDDVLEEMHAARRARSRANHWCTTCHGQTGPGSPCYMGEEEPEDEPEDEGDFCGGCNPEPTVSELECGKCDSCGKELL